jgi:hypothetical protein
VFTDGDLKTAPAVIRIDRQEENLQSHVIGNGRLMAQDFTPRKSFNADALMVFVAPCRRFVGAYPCADVGRVESPFVSRRPTRSPLDDVSP